MNRNTIPPSQAIVNLQNIQEAERFLSAIAPTGDRFTFQTFDDDKARKDAGTSRGALVAVRHGTLAKRFEALTRLSKRGAGIFVTVNRTDLKARTEENIKAVRALFVDLDGAPLTNIARIALEPTVVVETSAGHFHAYWRVEGVELSEFGALQGRLAALMDGDPGVKDLPRVMRLPGFPHQKDPANPQPARIISNGGAPHAIADFRAALEAAVKKHGRAPAETPAATESNPFTRHAEESAHGPVDFDELESAVLSLPIGEEFSDYEAWLKIGMGIHRATEGEERGLVLFKKWSAGDPEKYSAKACEEKWKSFDADKSGGVTAGTIFYLAGEHGWRGPSERGQDRRAGELKDAPIGKRKKTGEFKSWDGIEPENFDWLWRHWLARGELHLIAGAIGAGKTTIALSLAACLTRGGEWPDGSKAAKGRVLFWSGEDSVNKTLIPRLMAMGGDRSRIGGISVVEGGKKRSFDPAADLDILRDKLDEAQRRGEPMSLIVIDPFIVIAKTDSHKNAETRRDMQPLVDLAREFDAAVLGVTHYTKGTQKQAVNERVTGSLAFGAQARAIFAAVVQHDDSEPDECKGSNKTKGSFIRTKSNFGPSGSGFGYEIEPTQVSSAPYAVVECTAIKWGDPVDGAAQRLVDEAEGRKEGGGGAIAKAMAFLADILAGGPRASKDVEEEAVEAHGMSKKTLRRAREELRVLVEKETGVERGRWMWSLPAGVTVKKGPG